jgi:hypothetical protein
MKCKAANWADSVSMIHFGVPYNLACVTIERVKFDELGMGTGSDNGDMWVHRHCNHRASLYVVSLQAGRCTQIKHSNVSKDAP